MYMQPSRFEKRIAVIHEEAEQGKFGIKLHLYPSEYRKLDKMGFSLSKPFIPYNCSQKIWVSWRNLRSLVLDGTEPLYRYLTLQIDSFPETECVSDTCFVKAMRFNLANCTEPEFVHLFLDMLKNNCCF